MKCFRCSNEAIIQVGKDKTPLCEQHLTMFLKGYKRLIDKLQELNDKLSTYGDIKKQ